MAIVNSNTTNYLLREANTNTVRFPLVTLNQIILSNTPTSYDNAKIAQGGVIQRKYVPHDITPVVAVVSEPLTVDASLYAIEDKYINITTNTLHTFRSSADSGYYWTAGTYGGATDLLQRGQRLYVDIAQNRMYHWHGDNPSTSSGGSFVQVGFNETDISTIAASVASAVVNELESQNDLLRAYDTIS